jgi:uncharacterized membrane protein YkvA (DUF1232 family)
MDNTKYGKSYSDEGFWTKLKKFAKDAGQKVVYSGLTLYYALDSEKTALKDKLIIYGALGYLISPLDIIPDILVPAGYLDDLGVLVFAAGRVALSIDKVVKQKARDKMQDFFGEELNTEDLDDVDRKMVDDEGKIK